jgi:hypothetical protein
MKSSVFWDMTPCSPVKVNQRFGISAHLQGRSVSQARNQHEAGSKQSSASCFCVGFHSTTRQYIPEDLRVILPEPLFPLGIKPDKSELKLQKLFEPYPVV